jgi:two-component system chemotaxis response regulator CheB
MNRQKIIVIGASAGGVEALTKLVAGLPADLQAAIFVVLHISPEGTSVLPKILNRAGQLQALHPKHGQAIEQGRIYVAPPDFHLLVKPGYIHLARGPHENRHRPAIDPLFRTAAQAYGPRVIGVVLSGVLDDGTAGLLAVKMRGGVAVVQDPDDAYFSSMPRNAIENVEVNYILPVSEIPPVLVELVRQPLSDEGVNPVSGEMEIETDMAELEPGATHNHNRPGTPSAFACPECGGVLWEINDDNFLRFRCRVGHAYSSDSLLAEQSEALEDALWSALRALEESGTLADRMARRARENNQNLVAMRYEKRAKSVKQQAEIIRQVLLQGTSNIPEKSPSQEI